MNGEVILKILAEDAQGNKLRDAKGNVISFEVESTISLETMTRLELAVAKTPGKIAQLNDTTSIMKNADGSDMTFRQLIVASAESGTCLLYTSRCV